MEGGDLTLHETAKWLLWALQPKAGSWTSQRALEAQVAMLRQQLDIAAATQLELQKEIEVCCAPSHPLSVL